MLTRETSLIEGDIIQKTKTLSIFNPESLNKLEPILTVKVNNTSITKILFSMIWTTIPNLKLFFEIKIMKGFILYKKVWPFLKQCKVFHLWTYPEFKCFQHYQNTTQFYVLNIVLTNRNKKSLNVKYIKYLKLL